MHKLHDADRDEENLPDAQLEQPVEPIAAYCPKEQLEQLEEPVLVAYMPLVQPEQVVALATENIPAPQLKQLVAPAAN